MTAATFHWHTHIAEIDRDAWNHLAEPLATPFLEWDWLHNLETSGCLQPEQGWQPCHLSLTTENGDLLAAAPLYVKGHSWGEFVFDQQWSDVSHQLGIPYYPKLIGMSPFTPAMGYRFLIRPELNQGDTTAAIMRAIDAFCDTNEIAGCHFLHTDPAWVPLMKEVGMKPWLHHSLIWENHNFMQFEDYVAGFKSKQRNNIRRERKRAAEHLIYKVIPGEEAPPYLFGKMYDFYERTCIKFYKWSHYLNREFFASLARDLPHRTLMIAAYDKDGNQTDPLAMSFQVRKGDHLYGRYWGCRENYDQLHFEICYYQTIAWAIDNGITHFDAGSGNARHKQRRGFPAVPNYSLHRFYHPTMQKIWDDHIHMLNHEEERQIKAINRELGR